MDLPTYIGLTTFADFFFFLAFGSKMSKVMQNDEKIICVLLRVSGTSQIQYPFERHCYIYWCNQDSAFCNSPSFVLMFCVRRVLLPSFLAKGSTGNFKVYFVLQILGQWFTQAPDTDVFWILYRYIDKL